MISTTCEDGRVVDREVDPGGQPQRPGRAGLRMRDMVGAVAVLLAIVGLIVTVTRGCSFDPGGPDVSPDTAPSVDVSAKLDDAVRTVGFPLRRPALPGGWRANSSSTAPVGTGARADVVIRVGWLTPAGRYVQLGQSGGDLAEVVAAETGEAAADTGSVEVGGAEWRTYPSRRDEVAWATTVAGAVTVITGSGDEDEFRVLATAVLEAEPLPRP
ncbi:DUF4245 domain-containing protein [Actinophytocola xanthii]|uniref:DUF4245 domain-containing protein n=1 Tax=Actinophytocola xanthii TaxID=1912961 RepID=A0A1Q8CMS7_9PSEU|nr:DUF4245 domain-containing protein [Actinophytocola xanthii]OLF15656.1 hypothetical protein BU204_20670 [Actinophytocola xanthii]